MCIGVYDPKPAYSGLWPPRLRSSSHGRIESPGRHALPRLCLTVPARLQSWRPPHAATRHQLSQPTNRSATHMHGATFDSPAPLASLQPHDQGHTPGSPLCLTLGSSASHLHSILMMAHMARTKEDSHQDGSNNGAR